MFEVGLEIDGQRVGAGMFDVLPRVGESVHVRIHTPEESRSIEGRVIDIRHKSRVVIKDGKVADAELSIDLTLADATVVKLENECTSDD